MLETITAYIDQHQLLPAHGNLIVAVSGGADSLCLLHVLHQLCGPEKRYPNVSLHVAHLNHMLRGDASFDDAAYVTEIAQKWGLTLTVGQIDVPALAREERRSLEDAARVARYRFLREVAHGQPVAVAHHADDQVETLLLHWLRGGGTAGMVGMLPRQHDIIRPLLEVTRSEIIAYCEKYDLNPLEDVSNADPRFLRNRIRHELLSLLESMNPGIRATLLRNAEVMRVDAVWIDAQVEHYWSSVVVEEHSTSIHLSVRALRLLPLSLQRHVLRHVTARLCDGQSPLELRHYLLLEEFFGRESDGEERTLHLPDSLQVRRHLNEGVFERLSIQEKLEEQHPFSASDDEIELPIPGTVAIAGTPWIASAEIVSVEVTQRVMMALQHNDWAEVWRLLPSNRHTVYSDGERIGATIQIRTRRPGDRIRPLGMAHEKKVQDVLVDAHFPRNDRATIPLFFSGEHCIWLAGVCLDDRVRLTASTQCIVRLSIQPANAKHT